VKRTRWLLIASIANACTSGEVPRPDSGQVAEPAQGITRRSPQEIARQAMPAVVVLTMHDRSGQPVSLGSGFFVDQNVIATNAHVIRGSASGSAKSIVNAEQQPITGVVGVDESHDLALLVVGNPGPALTLATDRGVEIGQEVYAIGNPEGLEGTFSAGILSAKRPFGSDTLLQLTAPLSPGSSGGPVLDGHGDVIGVATATFREGQNLNFAVPATHVAALLRSRHEPKPLRSVGSRRLATSWLGDRSPAVVGENFQWDGDFAHNSGYTISLRNRSNDDVRNVYCLLIFHDDAGRPIEADPVFLADVIPAGLAQRASGRVDPSVKRLTTSTDGYISFKFRPRTKLEYRVLNYEVVR
jgi:S1-C subfamily serine protease